MTFLAFQLLSISVVLILISCLKFIYINIRRVKVRRKVKVESSENEREVEEILSQPPGPFPYWPILGNLTILSQYKNPFEGFSALSKSYGEIYSLKLGTSKFVVVNSVESIKEVLNQNGKFFVDRPHFERFSKIVGGDRNNCKSNFLRSSH